MRHRPGPFYVVWALHNYAHPQGSLATQVVPKQDFGTTPTMVLVLLTATSTDYFARVDPYLELVSCDDKRLGKRQ